MFRAFLFKAAAVTMLALGTVVFAPAPAEACTARFTCDPGVSPVCWFRLFYRNGNSNVFTVPAGGARRIFGLTPGETFCSSNRGVPGRGCDVRRIRMAC